MVAAADRARQERDSWHERFPSCNSRWAQGSGGEVWCDGTNIVPRLVGSIYSFPYCLHTPNTFLD